MATDKNFLQRIDTKFWYLLFFTISGPKPMIEVFCTINLPNIIVKSAKAMGINLNNSQPENCDVIVQNVATYKQFTMAFRERCIAQKCYVLLYLPGRSVLGFFLSTARIIRLVMLERSKKKIWVSVATLDGAVMMGISNHFDDKLLLAPPIRRLKTVIKRIIFWIKVIHLDSIVIVEVSHD